jgi:hypothetical protein
MDKMKMQIEKRYNRLSTGHRRPSFEYLEPTQIKEIFVEHVENKEEFLNLSDSALLDFYTRWYEENFPVEATNPKETIAPDLE